MKSNADHQRAYRERQKFLRKEFDDSLDFLRKEVIPMLLKIKEEIVFLRKEITNSYVSYPSLDKKTPPHLPKELIPLPPPISPPQGGSFDQWWEAYPHKVGKGDARKAFAKALTKTSLDQLFAGLGSYKSTKPLDRSWCNPATWLNQERWTDMPATNGHMNSSSALDSHINGSSALAIRTPSSKCSWPACSCSVRSQCQAVNGELHV